MPVINPHLFQTPDVIYVQALNNGSIGVITRQKAVLIYDPALDQTTIKLKIDDLNIEEGAYTFSHDGGYFAFSHHTSKGHALRLIDTQSKKLIRSYATQDNPIEQLAFGPSSTYIVGGTSTGRVFLWRVDSVNLIARLSSFPEYTPHLLTPPKQNYVSAIAFSNTLIATSGYGGSVVITNLVTQANTKRLKPGKRRIDALCFMGEHYIISGNEDGLIEIMHIDEQHPIKRIPTSIGAIKKLIYLEASHCLLAVSKYDHIGLIDIDRLEVLDPNFIMFSTPISTVDQIDPATLVVSLNDGELKLVKLAPFDDFRTLVEDKEYHLAYTMLDNEPLLKFHPAYEKLANGYEQAYDKALHALETERMDDAKIFLSPYAKVRQKAQHIQALFNAFDNYRRLQYLIKEKKYAAAYGMVNQYLPLQETNVFHQLEELWNSAFAKAQKLMLKGEDKKAKAAFGDFLTVPAKSDYIRMVLHKNDLIVAFSKAIHDHNYTALKQVTDQEPLLKQLPSYKKAMRDCNQLPEDIMRAIKTNQFDRAFQLADELQYIPHLKHHYAHIVHFMERAERLYELLQQDDELRYYELLDQSSDLRVLPQSKKMEQKWEKRIHECEEATVTGNVSRIKAILGPLVNLRSRSDKTGNLFRAAYQIQLKYYLTQGKTEHLKQGIEQYAFLFGIDNEIRQLIKVIQKEDEHFELQEEQIMHRPRSLWLTLTHGDVPDDIASFDS